MGADLEATDDVGNNALHYAAYHRLSALVQFLVDQGAALEARNRFGETPLWLSELAIQFYGGGTYQIVPTDTGDLLRSLGAEATTPCTPPTVGRVCPPALCSLMVQKCLRNTLCDTALKNQLNLP